MIKLNLFHNPKSNQALAKPDIQHPGRNSATPLAEVLPGKKVKVTGFEATLSTEHRVHFIAYGLQPGTWVEILQQSPVTILRFDNTELALERSLTGAILCQP